MTNKYWPTSLPQEPMLDGYEGGPVDTRASFATENRQPITRNRFTGAVVMIPMSFMMSLAEFQAFETWFQDDLSNGATKFCMRDPLTDTPYQWIFAPGEQPYRWRPRSAILVRVTATLMRLPGTPWFADYVPAGVSRVPDFVADYDGGVYGVDGVSTAASALTDIAGDYLVERTTTTAITTAYETLVAGDIPATAPAGTTKILGWAL